MLLIWVEVLDHDLLGIEEQPLDSVGDVTDVHLLEDGAKLLPLIVLLSNALDHLFLVFLQDFPDALTIHIDVGVEVYRFIVESVEGLQQFLLIIEELIIFCFDLCVID